MKIWQRIAGHLVLLFLIIVLVQLSVRAAQAQAPSVKLKFSGVHPEVALMSRGYKFFMSKVTEKTNGRITFDAYWGGRLVSSPETIDGTGSGMADLSSGVWLSYPNLVPLGCFDMNFLFNSKDYRLQTKIKRQMYDEIPALNGELAKFNLGPAPCFWPISPYHLLSKKPVKNPADLKGMRIGLTPIEFLLAMKVVGAVPVISTAIDFYDRLERGVIDAIILPVDVSYVYKLQEIAKYHTTINLVTAAIYTVFINLDLWKKLSPEDKKAFIEAGKESEVFYVTELDKYVETTHKAFKSAGVQYYDMPAEEIKKWMLAMPDIPADWAKKMEAQGKPGWQIVDRYLALSKKGGFEFPRKWGVK